MALPIVRAWSGLDFEGGEFDVRSEATGVQKVSLESVLSNDFNNIFQSIQKIYFRWDPRQNDSPDPSEADLNALGLTGGLPVNTRYGDGVFLASSNPTFSIPYNIEDMKKLLGAYKGRKGVTFTVGPATDDSEIDYERFSVEFNAIKEKLGAPGEKRFDIYELLGEPEPASAPAAGSAPAPGPAADNDVKHRFVAYFKYMPTFGKTDEMLKGKLVSELAASQILDDAAISSIDVKDAAYRLAAYAKRAGQTQPEQYDSLSRIVDDLAAQFNRGEEAPPPDVNIAAANAVRRALIDKKMIPIRNMLMAKEDQEAGGKPTDIDAPTQEFERDSAADMCTVEMVKKTFREMVYTTAGALFSTASDATRIVGNVSSFDAEPETGLISLGAIVYAGKTENFVTSGKLPGDDADRRARPESAVSAVKEILLNNSIPINYALLVARIEQVFKTSLENSIGRINKYAISTLARVEHAREIDLLYTPPTVYYGTDSESEYFGTGSNVTMITDCAFIAARVLNSLYEDGAFEQNIPPVLTVDGVEGYWDAKFTLRGQTAGDDVETIINELTAQVDNSYTGHCTVRTADMGRILGGSLVNKALKEAIETQAFDNGYRSIPYLSNPIAYLPFEAGAETKFYHQIWKHELGNHAVAQGGARLEESHMMVPFLVRATSDSEHVVPTLCAFDDWIGPTEMYERIEQSALMEIENYAQSRPTVKYAKGGRGRTLRDIGTMIKTAEDSVDPINMLKIIMSVEQGHRDKAATCCAMLMTAVHSHSTFSEEVKKGGLARQRASETKVRELAARIGNLPVN